jgi:hypothetical protein
MSESSRMTPWSDLESRITRVSFEGVEILDARGAVVLLRNFCTGEFYTVKEKYPKERIGREAGQLSVISETAKAEADGCSEESVVENMLGAMGEYPLMVGDRLLISSELSYLGVYPLTGKGEAHVFIIDIDTETNDFRELRSLTAGESDSEVKPTGWMSLDQIIRHSELRTGMRELLQWAKQQDKFHQFINRDTTKDFEIVDMDSVCSYAFGREQNNIPDLSGERYSNRK